MNIWARVSRSRSIKPVLVAGLLIACLLTGCARAKKSDYAFQPSDVTSVPMGDPFVQDINRLGINALKLVNQDEAGGGNLILSPISLATALSVLSNGAAGATLEQINGIVNSRGLSQNEHNNRYRDLISSFYNRKDMVILPANSLWIKRNYPFKESFAELAKAWYDADVFSLNDKASSAVNEVNRWVSDRTKGLITDPLSEIHPLTVMLLVNTLYFRGTWENPFDDSFTRKEDFTLSTGETVKVDMMNSRLMVPFHDAGDLKAAKLYYRGGVSMLFLRPEENVNDLLSDLTAEKLFEINSHLAIHTTDLKVPRLDFGYKSEMSDCLKALGMVDAFTDGVADFSRMVDGKKPSVSRVLHECRLKLDEEGTEAAAVTAIAVTATSAMPEPEQIVDFYLDKPFVFAIVDERTGAVLFLGKVENPLG